jgi:hypothetical protein
MSTQSYKPEPIKQEAGSINTSKGSTLVDRSQTTKLLYNYLTYVSPADINGIKKAYVTVGDKGIRTRPANNAKAVEKMYGKKPTTVAEDMEPMALIDKASEEDVDEGYRGFGDDLIRSALRRIVDEV